MKRTAILGAMAATLLSAAPALAGGYYGYGTNCNYGTSYSSYSSPVYSTSYSSPSYNNYAAPIYSSPVYSSSHVPPATYRSTSYSTPYYGGSHYGGYGDIVYQSPRYVSPASNRVISVSPSYRLY